MKKLLHILVACILALSMVPVASIPAIADEDATPTSTDAEASSQPATPEPESEPSADEPESDPAPTPADEAPDEPEPAASEPAADASAESAADEDASNPAPNDPSSTTAEVASEESAQEADEEADSEDDSDEEAKDEEAKDEEDTAAFKQSVTAADIEGMQDTKVASGLKITVEAPEGAFPKDAQLKVAAASRGAQADAAEAIDAQRTDDLNVAAALTFDIKVVDKCGNELQPADGNQVTVTFQMDAVANPNVDTQVYHLAEKGSALKAESLDVDTSGRTATVESDGFSYYTVEFTYGDLQYVMPGDTSVPLADIMDALGLAGAVDAVETSNPDLFSASNETGEWVVTAHKPFKTDEQMTITIRGLSYDIAMGYEATTHNIRVTDSGTATLMPGGNKDVTDPQTYLRDAMESLAGNRKNVTAFKQASVAEWAAAGSPTSTNVAESGEPVYMWYDNGTIYWYSEADTVYLNTNACWMFQAFTNLTDISGLANLDASRASDVDRMFINCVSLTDISPIADWDTHNFTNMRFMFGASGASNPMTLSDLSPLSNWDVSNVTDMNSVFKFAPNISDVSPLANWDVSNVTDFEQMFNMNGTTSGLSDVSALAGWKPLSGENFNKMFQKTPMTKAYLESTLFTAMRGTWTDPSTTSGTAGGGKFTPYTKKTITLTKTWADDSDAYGTRPTKAGAPDGDALAITVGYTGTGTAPSYTDAQKANVPVYDTTWAYNGNTWTATLEIYTNNTISDYTVTEGTVSA